MVEMNYKKQIIELPQNRVWRSYQGGRILDGLVGPDNPRDSHFPEDWIGSVTPACNPGSQYEHEGISTVRVDGQELLFFDLIARDPNYFLGKDHLARYGEQPMVLVKLLDSAVRLQLQVHPTAEFARAHLQSNSGKAEGYFDKIRVKPGDVLFIPGGVPHAIGGGIFLVEIMEPSDLVVRFEFESNGYTLPESARFMNRGLDFCLDMFDFKTKPESQVRKEHMFEPRLETTYGKTAHRYHLVGAETTPCFQVKKFVIKGIVEREEDTFFTGVVTAGHCVLKTAGTAIELDTFDKFFCPAGLGAYTIEAEEEVQILECFPPA